MPVPVLMLALGFAFLLAGCDGVESLLPYDEAVDPPSAESSAMLAAVNALRAEERQCGSERFAPAPPLVWNGRLHSAADAHTDDMASHDHFDHIGTDGSTVGDRVSREGYEWSRVGENIARGQQTIDEVVADWAESAGHCANLMNPSFAEFGAAEQEFYWTQVFGRPR
ncbi:MAG: CAP domain-containing protein [Rhodothermaceae bacterium]|nr:CAP domain-containing protein [Rhodothermaceae bacterium]